MHIRIFYLALIIICLKSYAKNEILNKKIELDLDYQIQHQLTYNDDILDLKYYLEDYVNSNSYEDYKRFWNYRQDDIITYQYDSLPKAIKKSYPTYKPSIYAIDKIGNDQFLVKIALLGNPEGFYSIWSSHNLILKTDYYDCFKILNTADIEIRERNCIVSDNVTFYTTQEKLSKREIEKFKDYETRLTRLLGLDIEFYSVVIYEDTVSLSKSLGYEYRDGMYGSGNIGGMFISYDNLILSGNGSAFYPHEIVHLYVDKLNYETHNLISEGFATFLGGSLGYNYEYHVQNFKNYCIKNQINLTENLEHTDNYNILVGQSTSFQYAYGAFLCHTIFKHKGIKGILNLLNSGKSQTDIKTTLFNLLNVDAEELESLLYCELTNFKPIDVL
ncbi:MAG: hypothetical protein GVY05_07975 [Bacteroidetes bacterium]|nr:hypothetical protein [Bacteroidota bacterium]